MSKGAQASDSVYNLLVREGIVEGKKRAVKMEKPKAPVVEEAKIEEAKEAKTEEVKPAEEIKAEQEATKVEEVKVEEVKTEDKIVA